MKRARVELALIAILGALFVAFFVWQTPGDGGRLTHSDVDDYIRKIDSGLRMEANEKREALARMRSWGESDDGRPVYMLNVMRYYDQIQPVPGAESIGLTPVAANSHYEKTALPMLTRVGAYPLVGGEASGVRGSEGKKHSNLAAFDPRSDDWNRVLVVRYPNRRAFLELMSNPEFLAVLPYKTASLEVALVPVAAEAVVPDPRWIVGFGFVIVILAMGWIRSASRRQSKLVGC